MASAGGAEFEDLEGADLELYDLDRKASGQLAACRALAQAVGSTIAALSEAGSGLQKKVAEVHSAELPESVGPCLLQAFATLGVELVGLAASLSGELIRPLQELSTAAEADAAQARAELESLRRYEVRCFQGVKERTAKKEQAVQEFEQALTAWEKLEESKQKSRNSFWKLTGANTSALRSRLDGATSLQSAALEALVFASDTAAEAKLRLREGEQKFRAQLHHFSLEQARVVKTVLRRGAAAWVSFGVSVKEGASALTQAAGILEDRPDAIGALVRQTGELPCDAEDAARAESAAIEQAQDSQREEQFETRELGLLEKEAALLRLEESLEHQQQLLEDQRRRVALEQAESLARFEELRRDGCTSPVLEVSLDSPMAASRSPCRELPEKERTASEDDVWDMDWSAVRPTLALDSLSPAEPAGCVDACGGAFPPSPSRLSEAPTISPCAGDSQNKELFAECAEEPSVPQPIADQATDPDELQRKQTAKRLLADLHDGEDHCVAPLVVVEEGKMPGAGAPMAENLERRRRMVEQFVESETSAILRSTEGERN